MCPRSSRRPFRSKIVICLQHRHSPGAPSYGVWLSAARQTESHHTAHRAFRTGPFRTGPFRTGPFRTGPFRTGRWLATSIHLFGAGSGSCVTTTSQIGKSTDPRASNSRPAHGDVRAFRVAEQAGERSATWPPPRPAGERPSSRWPLGLGFWQGPCLPRCERPCYAASVSTPRPSGQHVSERRRRTVQRRRRTVAHRGRPSRRGRRAHCGERRLDTRTERQFEHDVVPAPGRTRSTAAPRPRSRPRRRPSTRGPRAVVASLPSSPGSCRGRWHDRSAARSWSRDLDRDRDRAVSSSWAA